MKTRFYLTILFMVLVYCCESQTIDTVIKNDVYVSYFSKKLHEPIYVTYKVYKGGGDCSRTNMDFRVDKVKGTATPKDYKACGYDAGHLADAEDFSNDCTKEEKTFRFYNCVPQTPHLNRGSWKHYENDIRKISQKDSVLVITGSIFGKKKLPNSQVAVPDYCWKVVQSLSSKKILYCFIVANDDVCKEQHVTVATLQKKLGYIIPLKK